MSQLTEKLHAAGELHRGTDLGALLQWAMLHITGQDAALSDLREAYARAENDVQRLTLAVQDAKTSVESALSTIESSIHPPIEFDRDYVAHINLMAAHGDPDYLRRNGMSVRHTDCRASKSR